MDPSFLPTQGLRTIHTPAIRDCAEQAAETRAPTEILGSTRHRVAVHKRGPTGRRPSVHADFRLESRS